MICGWTFPEREVNRKKRFLDISSGFQYLASRAGDHVNRGDEGLRIAIAPGACSGRLEQTV